MITEPRLTVTGLVLSQRGRHQPALDVTLRPGQLGVVHGRSVADVGRLLLACAGQLPSAGGEVRIDGALVRRDPPPALISYAGRAATIVGSLTPVENLVLSALAAGRRSSPELIKAAEAALDGLGLAAASWHNLVEQLSGGQQQRVMLARLFFTAPAVLVLDRPTSDLDPDNVERVRVRLNEIRAGGSAVLLATDEPELAENADHLVRV